MQEIKYKLSDLIDIGTLSQTFELLYSTANIPNALIDIDGKILASAGWQKICTEFHRKNPESEALCVESDTHISAEIAAGEPYCIYECKLGLVDSSCPVIIDGHHLGNVFTGQMFHTPLTEERRNRFRAQANQFGYDEQAYMEALEEVPVFPLEKLEEILKLLANLAEQLGNSGLAKLREIEQSERLKISQERFDLAMSATKDGVFDWNLVTNEIYYSPVWKSMLGYKDDELPNDFSIWEKLTKPEDVKASWEMQQELIRKQRDRFEMEFQMLHKNGHWVDILSRAKAVFDARGEAIRIVGTHIDITDSKQTELAISKEKERIENILEGTNAGAWDWNIETNELSINERWAAIMGYTVGELEPVNLDTWKSTIHSDDLLLAEEMLEKHFNREFDYFDVNFRQIHKNGKLVWVNARGKVSKWSDDGKPIFMSGTHLDITRQKDAEQSKIDFEKQLHQSQKLEAVGTMVGGISHEFNNVLQSMFLYGGLVQDALPDNEELRSNFQHILHDGNRARDLIKQILTFSRKTKVAMKPQALHEMAMEVLVLERASLPANIEIQQDIDLNCGLVLCDKTQIHQILINLCNNAQHAMDDKGGTLTVSLKPTRASLNNGDTETDAVELKVSDTGHGIDAADLENIFDPFFTTKESEEGTGLGLSVIHGIVEMMEGNISATSEVGKGSTFRIYFPVTDIVEADTVINSVENEELKSRSILLVDDEESIRSVTQIILMQEGFKVDSAANGKQALELFKANPGKYDLIVTDKSMPKMSGVELTTAIRNSKSDIPIILSTGQLGIEDEKEFKSIGITSYIQKPWTAEELIERIQGLDYK